MDTTSSEENTIDYQYIMTKVGYLEPVALSNCTNNIIKENVIVPAGEKVDIDVRIWLDSTLPNTEIGKSFYAKLKIEGLAVYNDDEDIDNSKLSLRYMEGGLCRYKRFFCNDVYRNYIKNAAVVDYIDISKVSINVETNEKIMWDVSTASDGSVIAWLEDNGEMNESGNKLYDLYIGSRNMIYSKNLSYAFYDFQSLINISFSNLDTSLTTDMTGMFTTSSSLLSLDLSKFNVSNVTSMGTPTNYSSGGMFHGCTSLVTLKLDNWNTSKVKEFGNMFRDCISLTDLDISSFDTSSATNIGRMFEKCSALTTLDLSNFDTENVVNMFQLFYGCRELEDLDVSNFDTGNVTNLSRIFYDCNSLTSLDLGNFDTRNVTSFYGLFESCTNLVEVNLKSFDTSNVTDFSRLFYNCYKLTRLNVSNFDTGNATDMSDMFYACRSLIELDLSNFDTSKVMDMSGMFKDCNCLVNLDLSSFDIRNVTNMKWLFYMCHKLQTSLVINCNSVSNYTEMFLGATTAEGSSIVLYYVGDNPSTTDVNESTESLVNSLVNGTTIINGGCVGNYCTV